MIRRLAGSAFLACVLCALLVGSASAGVPPGPRLALLRYVGERTELLTVDANGGRKRLVPGVRETPSWSADGSKMAFVESSGSKHHRRTDIYLANADGSDPHRIPGTREGFDPVLSPDGHTLAFARERLRKVGPGLVCCFRAAVWLLDLNSGSPRRITPWRSEVFETPASFRPDGLTLAVEWEKEAVEERHRVLALHLNGGAPTLLAENAIEPVYSPDGTRLALVLIGRVNEVGGLEVTPTHLAIANADGSDLTKLTHTKAEEWSPTWDPSGQRLAYVQYSASGTYESFFGDGDSLVEINPDGTCRTKVLSSPKTILANPTWQPGPGREAGPIAC